MSGRKGPCSSAAVGGTAWPPFLLPVGGSLRFGHTNISCSTLSGFKCAGTTEPEGGAALFLLGLQRGRRRVLSQGVCGAGSVQTRLSRPHGAEGERAVRAVPP